MGFNPVHVNLLAAERTLVLFYKHSEIEGAARTLQQDPPAQLGFPLSVRLDWAQREEARDADEIVVSTEGREEGGDWWKVDRDSDGERDRERGDTREGGDTDEQQTLFQKSPLWKAEGSIQTERGRSSTSAPETVEAQEMEAAEAAEETGGGSSHFPRPLAQRYLTEEEWGDVARGDTKGPPPGFFTGLGLSGLLSLSADESSGFVGGGIANSIPDGGDGSPTDRESRSGSLATPEETGGGENIDVAEVPNSVRPLRSILQQPSAVS
uniref:Uncharacterized protein n=1 Tax=Chromera velia CCMP2878 TaxID=1169474 RepID=A0A0K6S7D3_9ALVE|eukprot:Cvel_19626.t1-p1 / transcript=Cvel_19626.t1 / gene=Cvel_19626 / organism=Chromera_velia_CCMP2878 / gene_product=hypothetical protein / transcript_product=hypothetical protein / location=Cvel_scaffold1708:4461-5799(+) / protein_length=266 / sequence_SO=supercontig / SO=protein_coding / is_pseudo=false